VTVKKNEEWNDAVPKFRVEDTTNEESEDSKKRKRSIKVFQKKKKRDSSDDDEVEEHENLLTIQSPKTNDNTLLQSVTSQLEEFNERKVHLETSISGVVQDTFTCCRQVGKRGTVEDY
jgi:hypothetical protein